MKTMYKDFGKSLIDPKYCCCAVPVVNFGIYSILLEQGVVALAVGVMVFATPSVVGAYFPSFAGIIMAICCFVVAGLQPVGFVGVLREKTSTYRWYSLLNMLAVLASFAAAVGLVVSSAVNHNLAVVQCRTDYFTPTSAASGITAGAANATLTAQAETLCPAFAWADVGIMGGLWLILLLLQGYFIFVTRKYGTAQVSDHKLYHSVYSENPEAFTMSVLRSSRYNPGSVYSTHPAGAAAVHRSSGLAKGDDAWDHRPSTESLRDDKVYMDQHEAYPPSADPYGGGSGQHYRGESSGTMLPPHQQGYAAGGGDGGGNRESRYEDAYDERGAYGYEHDQGQGQGGYAGHQGEGYGYGAGQGQGQGQGYGG